MWEQELEYVGGPALPAPPAASRLLGGRRPLLLPPRLTLRPPAAPWSVPACYRCRRRVDPWPPPSAALHRPPQVGRMLAKDVRNNSAWNQRANVMQHKARQLGARAHAPRRLLLRRLQQRALRSGRGRRAVPAALAPLPPAADPSPPAAALPRRAGGEQAALRQLLSAELEFCADQLQAAPRNESPWNYLRGLFHLPGCPPHLLATFPAVPIICQEALSDSGCLQGAARRGRPPLAPRAAPSRPHPLRRSGRARAACTRAAPGRRSRPQRPPPSAPPPPAAAAGDWSCAPALATLEQYYSDNACLCAGMGEWQQALAAVGKAVESVLASLVADPIHAPYYRFRLSDLGRFKKLVLERLGRAEEGGGEGEGADAMEGVEGAAAAGGA
jgi:hypothetical protein